MRGLSDSVTGNAQAFGFSITVTVTFGLVDAAQGSPTLLEVYAFAMAGVAAFSTLNVAMFVLMERGSRPGARQRALLIGTATDFLAVAAAIGAAYGVTVLLQGWWAWLVAPFVAGVGYVLVQAVELAFGREADESEE